MNNIFGGEETRHRSVYCSTQIEDVKVLGLMMV